MTHNIESRRVRSFNKKQEQLERERFRTRKNVPRDVKVSAEPTKSVSVDKGKLAREQTLRDFEAGKVQRLNQPKKTLGVKDVVSDVVKLVRAQIDRTADAAAFAPLPGLGALGVIGKAGKVISATKKVKSVLGVPGLVTRGLPKFVAKPTLVQKLSKIGKSPKPFETFKTGLGEIGSRFATNTKSLSTTQKLLDFAKSPGGIVAIIGSYPFAGFIKEEALQTLGFATKSALDAGDLEGADTAVRETEDILDVSTWERLISLVPFANVAKQLLDFYNAARVKLEQDKRLIAKKRGEIEFEGTSIGEDIAARDERIKEEIAERDERKTSEQEQTTQKFADIEEQRQETRTREIEEDTARFERAATKRRETELTERTEDTKFFQQQALLKRQEEQADQEEDAAFFANQRKIRREEELQNRLEDSEFFKLLAKGRDNNQKSQLSFGLFKFLSSISKDLDDEEAIKFVEELLDNLKNERR